MKSISEQLTYSTVLIRCTYANGTSGSGTGFIITLCHHKEKNLCVPVLITNNHVVENSTETIFEFCKADENQQPVDTETVSFVCPSNLWIPHPDPHVDLRCLPIAPIIQLSKEQNKEIFYNGGVLYAAGIDVLCEEPPRSDSPLLHARNCFVTPHIAWATLEARTRLLQICEANLRAYLEGCPQNVVS